MPTPVVCLGDGVELLLACCVPDKAADVLAQGWHIQLLLQKVHPDGLLVFVRVGTSAREYEFSYHCCIDAGTAGICPGSPAEAPDHAGLADPSVPHDDHLELPLRVDTSIDDNGSR
jgi:hypothetical protein